MTGEYTHSVDAKGRLFMPAKLREELGEGFTLCRGLGGCLFVYSLGHWVKIEEHVNAMPMTQAIKIQRIIFPTASVCEPDAQGRILIPQKLRQYADLTKIAVIAGMGNHAEIWNADKWEALTTDFTEELLGSYMDELGF